MLKGSSRAGIQSPLDITRRLVFLQGLGNGFGATCQDGQSNRYGASAETSGDHHP